MGHRQRFQFLADGLQHVGQHPQRRLAVRLPRVRTRDKRFADALHPVLREREKRIRHHPRHIIDDFLRALRVFLYRARKPSERILRALLHRVRVFLYQRLAFLRVVFPYLIYLGLGFFVDFLFRVDGIFRRLRRIDVLFRARLRAFHRLPFLFVEGFGLQRADLVEESFPRFEDFRVRRPLALQALRRLVHLRFERLYHERADFRRPLRRIVLEALERRRGFLFHGRDEGSCRVLHLSEVSDNLLRACPRQAVNFRVEFFDFCLLLVDCVRQARRRKRRQWIYLFRPDFVRKPVV